MLKQLIVGAAVAAISLSVNAQSRTNPMVKVLQPDGTYKTETLDQAAKEKREQMMRQKGARKKEMREERKEHEEMKKEWEKHHKDKDDSYRKKHWSDNDEDNNDEWKNKKKELKEEYKDKKRELKSQMRASKTEAQNNMDQAGVDARTAARNAADGGDATMGTHMENAWDQTKSSTRQMGRDIKKGYQDTKDYVSDAVSD